MIPRERLVLGTVKLGLPAYGYNSTSRPTAQESIAIIRHAWRKGIRLFDTALGYADALVLLRESGVPAENIICKCRPPLTPMVLERAWDMRWLIHNPTIEQLADVMIGCGVSVYTVAEVEAAQRLNIHPIQAPASCLNPDPGPIEYGRAPFLQGVLLRNPNLAPKGLERAVFDFQQICEDCQIGFKTLALHAAYGERIVFGVSSIEQLDQVLASCDKPDPPKEVIDMARSLSQSIDATAALPSLWSKP